MNEINNKLILKVIDLLSGEHDKLKEIAEVAKGAATDTGMKQEAKYDTRKIEASYLAGAQEKRVKELEIEINLLKNLSLSNNSNGSVVIGSIINLENNGHSKWYLLTPQTGGKSLEYNGIEYTIISKNSPIGKELIGLVNGDDFEVQTPKEIKCYTVTQII